MTHSAFVDFKQISLPKTENLSPAEVNWSPKFVITEAREFITHIFEKHQTRWFSPLAVELPKKLKALKVGGKVYPAYPFDAKHDTTCACHFAHYYIVKEMRLENKRT
jgi:hypothetical protein